MNNTKGRLILENKLCSDVVIPTTVNPNMQEVIALQDSLTLVNMAQYFSINISHPNCNGTVYSLSSNDTSVVPTNYTSNPNPGTISESLLNLTTNVAVGSYQFFVIMNATGS